MSDIDRPNLLFVISDQHRWSALGCAGNEDVNTPAFDSLASEGTRYRHAFANSPVCGPSRASLVTGQYPTTHGVIANDLPLSTDQPSVGETFREAGYRTGYIGKWHLDGLPREKFTPPGPRRQGFDDFWAVYNCAHDYFNTRYYRGGSDELIRSDGYEPAVYTDLALEFLEESADDDRPFCLFLAWGPPHDPYHLVPDEYRKRYDVDDVTLRPNAEPLLPGCQNNPDTAITEGPPVREWGPRTSEEFQTGWRYEYEDEREILADYYAAITALDEQFGRLVDALDRHGIADRTLLAYTSDHGDMMWSQGLNQKGYPYDESIRVPFILRWPDTIPAGSVDDNLISITDIAPTLLGLSGVDLHKKMEGSDLSAVLAGDADGPTSVFLTGDNWRGVRTERYTYARLAKDDAYQHVPGRHWLLFDNQADPYQQHNLVLDPEYRDVRRDLAEDLDDWLEKTGDPAVPTEDLVERLNLESEWESRMDWQREMTADAPADYGRDR